ncbi:MAG: hypothetical protein A2566_02125 [Candidatus Zambryskibacteria bacterium RIFOXYD1_FULL_40_13]|nr:MAG: hypothetical protein UT25_C0003G0063 [Parcubacteria group bacterium GW2011_GWC1_39_12]KKR18947.1 MAG: hypothetical protein UT49_C0005G0013 [Parcubacteria group bacterium GW2011_GWF1_39_37]KKR35576.1 MAG: hypothetical protein UT68_C0002G0002 [Parcubacteria group bacterium GW2011_GWC2_40_10]KKR51987.1 MAG: hypothetical protein UT89_C0004G0073 [Parcubacteria group bacterium GW2011_GWE1_40_20]KKR68488.1 MAG: hypothetical protein UU11_C0011G0035 [Parcubacteria group bacterium GW2011_GWF2_40_
MIQRKSTFFLGIFIFIIPFLGIPGSWRTFFIIISGLFLITLSIKITLPKRNIKSKTRREKITPVFVESMPGYTKENSIDSISAPIPEIKVDAEGNSVN